MTSGWIRQVRHSSTLAHLAILAALAALVGLAVWKFADDMSSLRSELLAEEIRTLRPLVVRAVWRIERELEEQDQVDLQTAASLATVIADWQARIDESNRYLYAAFVGRDGEILAHTDAQREGQRLAREWYETIAYEVGTDVVRTRSPALTSGRSAYDLNVSILVHGDELGSCHVGLSRDWFAAHLSAERRQFLLIGSLGVGAVLLLAGVAGAASHWLVRRASTLEDAVVQTYMQAASELGQLAAGLAHEIRNPLHALRLNLHAFRKTQEDRSALSPEETARMLAQSAEEIDRIDRLLQELIRFAAPVEPREELVHLNSELEGIIDFISQELLRNKVEVHLDPPPWPAHVRIDRGRLRQIVLNLLHNARDAMPEGGRVDVRLSREERWIELSVADRGQGIAEADMPRVFEPFFTTSETGSGLGLALVKRFVQEAGGQISCESDLQRGTLFRIRLPRASTSNSKTGAPA